MHKLRFYHELKTARPLAGGSDAVAAGEGLLRCPSGLPSPLVPRDPPTGGWLINLAPQFRIIDPTLNHRSISNQIVSIPIIRYPTGPARKTRRTYAGPLSGRD